MIFYLKVLTIKSLHYHHFLIHFFDLTHYYFFELH